VKDAKQGETYLSSEGVGVLAGLLIIGAILLWVTGSGKVTVALFLLAGAAMAGWAVMRRGLPAPSNAAGAARRESPAARPATLRFERAAIERPDEGSEDRLEAKAETRPEEPPEPMVEKPAGPPILPPTAAKLMKALESRSADGIGQTLRVETLIEGGEPFGVVHLVISGDGPSRDAWFGRDGDALPLEIIVGRWPPQGMAAVQISSKAVSAQQARLSQHEGTFLIENLSKTNATRVGGRALQEGERRALASGDLIEMGPVSIRYHLE